MLSSPGCAACAKVLIFSVFSNLCWLPLWTFQGLSDMGYVALEKGSFDRRLYVLPFGSFPNIMKLNLSFAGMFRQQSQT